MGWTRGQSGLGVIALVGKSEPSIKRRANEFLPCRENPFALRLFSKCEVDSALIAGKIN